MTSSEVAAEPAFDEGGREDLFRSFSSLSWSTMSNALDRSIWSSTVLFAGLFSLNPLVMSWIKSFNAETVEWFFLNPCWMSGIGRWLVSSGSSSLSRIFAPGQSGETGL